MTTLSPSRRASKGFRRHVSIDEWKSCHAVVAQLVAHLLAKERAAGPSPVYRSQQDLRRIDFALASRTGRASAKSHEISITLIMPL